MSDDELFRALAETCAALELELDDVVLHGGVLQVTIARPGGDLDLDRLTEASRAVSALLEARDELAPPGRYELEVSSPGVERRLRRPEQFRRALGERVSVRTEPGVVGDRRDEGRLGEVCDDGLTLVHDDGSERRLAFGEIERARTVFDWQAELSAHRAAERVEKAATRDARRGQRESQRTSHVPVGAAGAEGIDPETERAEDQ